jgi:hypothetical protein
MMVSTYCSPWLKILELTIDFAIIHHLISEYIIEKDMSSLPDVSLHNDAIEKAIDFHISGKPSFALIDKGRSRDERCCIWIEKGHFYGPIYNKALERFEPKFGLYCYEARNGYQYLAIGKLTKVQACEELFYSQYDGVNLLLSLVKDFGIDHRF